MYYSKKIKHFVILKDIPGGMAELVDATDLKSVDYCDREGSSPSTPIV